MLTWAAERMASEEEEGGQVYIPCKNPCGAEWGHEGWLGRNVGSRKGV